MDQRVLGLTVLGQTFESGCNHIMDIMAANDCTCKAFFICWLSIQTLTYSRAYKSPSKGAP